MKDLAEQVDALNQATILIAEDDAAVRSLLVRVLRLRGYHVVEAANGVEAVAAAASHGRPFQLLLTDVVMPRMNGPALAAHLLSHGHTQRVIYMTGYADLPLSPNDSATVLRKPFTPSTLTDAVRAALLPEA
jgi:two-component system, cell cycle sensor histidine kinase and response regulator CckA